MKAHLSSPQAKRSPPTANSSHQTPPLALSALLSPSSKSPGVLPSSPNRAAGAAAGAFLLQLVKETDSPPKDGAELGANLLQRLQGKPASKKPGATPEGKSAGSLLLESIQAGKQEGTLTPPSKQGTSDNGDDCILEAQMHTDGKRYVKAEGEWLVASGRYYCVFCKVFGNTLDEHLTSAHHAHNRKLHAAAGAADEAKQAQKTLWQALSTNAEEEGDRGPPPALCAPCAPCGEDQPSAPDLAERYPDPAEEWLAWVPIKEGEHGGERKLRCLLCSKWASGADHSGTGGSQEHLKNVAKYVHTQSQWYADVISQKRKWSTSPRPAGSPAPSADQGIAAVAAACLMQAPPAPAPAPLASLAATPWQSAWSQEHQRHYYWNMATGMVQWDPPPLLPSSR